MFTAKMMIMIMMMMIMIIIIIIIIIKTIICLVGFHVLATSKVVTIRMGTDLRQCALIVTYRAAPLVVRQLYKVPLKGLKYL